MNATCKNVTRQRNQRGFTLFELLISIVLVSAIVLVLWQWLRFSQQHYETIQATAQLNQTELMARDLLTKTIEKAGKNSIDAPFVPSLTNDGSPLAKYDVIGEALAVNYNDGLRCDGLVLNSDTEITDYFFVSVDSNNVLSLRCQAPGRDTTSLIANVEYMALRYHQASASDKGSLMHYNETLLGSDKSDWYGISRISVYLIIASDDAHYQTAPARYFNDDNNDFPSNNIAIDINTNADGRYRRALYFVIEPKWLMYNNNG